MRKVPPPIRISDEKLLRRIRRIRRITALACRLSGTAGRRIGRELIWSGPDGTVRLLAHNWDTGGIKPLYINLHGGCFVYMGPEMDEPHMARLARELDIRILNVGYRLAPEHRFPKALQDVLFVLEHVCSNAEAFGVDRERIVLGGTSSGGNLSAAAQIRLAERGHVGLRGLVLICPILDLDTDPYLKPTPRQSIPPRTARLFNAAYCRPEEARDPCVSPIFAAEEQLGAFPPTLVITGSEDALCTEGDQFADRLDKAGVSVTHRRFLGGAHGFTHRKTPLAREAWSLVLRFLQERTGTPAAPLPAY